MDKVHDTYPTKVTSKNAPIWLKKGSEKFANFVNANGTVPCDVAIASYINYYHGFNRTSLGSSIAASQLSKNTIVTLFNATNDIGTMLTLKNCNEQDVIFVSYDAIECPSKRNKMIQMLRKTKAFVYPPIDFHKYIMNKKRYLNDLQKAGIPLLPYRIVETKSIRTFMNAKQLKEWIQQKNWKGVIIQPICTTKSIEIKTYQEINKISPAVLFQYFARLRHLNFTKVILQELNLISKNYEIRTYWLNGKYTNSYGTKCFKSKNQRLCTLPDHILTDIKRLGKQVLEAILQYPYKHPMIRIDFRCCVSRGNSANGYFINKVDTMAGNLDPSRTKFPIVEKLAQECYKFALTRKGKPNVRGLRSTKKFNKPQNHKPRQTVDRPQKQIDWTKNAKYNNCYAYAINKYDPNAIQKRNPGNVRQPYGCKDVMAGVLKDNPEIRFHSGGYYANCPKGYYKGFLAVDRNPKANDFHFWREEPDGYWTHKLGSNLPSNVDSSGQRIPNPENSNRDFGAHVYSDSCGYFCVPK